MALKRRPPGPPELSKASGPRGVSLFPGGIDADRAGALRELARVNPEQTRVESLRLNFGLQHGSLVWHS